MQDFNSFKISLIKIRDCSQEETSLLNLAFFFWKSIWIQELKKINCEIENWADEFYRHDYLLLITKDNIPVGLHLYGIQSLELNSCTNQSYFESYTPEFITELKKRRISKVISMGWMTVNPSFAKYDSNLLFSKLVGYLAIRVCNIFDFDGLIAPVRNDNGFAAKVASWGSFTYGKKEVYNVPCDLIFVPPSAHIQLNELEQSFINYLWKEEDRNNNTQTPPLAA